MFDKLGNYTGSVRYFDKTLSVTPNDAVVLNNLGLALFYLKNYAGSITSFNKALHINSTDDNSLENKGMVLDKLGNHTRPYRISTR